MEHMCVLFELECPSCGSENGYLAEVEDCGRKFSCPDCSASWYDLKFLLENDSRDNTLD